MENETDEALMLAVAARQQQAFRILMGRYMPRAIRVAQRVVRNAAEADEIGQEAFLRDLDARDIVRSGSGAVHHLALPDRAQSRFRPRAQAGLRADRRRRRCAG
ncbi:sigma factor [Rhodopseudomonas sp. RCAM05734]|uniref:sigma factor n=1 Tax=Rhodopseudomonas sp. RCAM05734 TaxID=3457549 RepID=UPI004043AF76